MIVLNNVETDSRVKREALALKEEGYIVKIIGVLKNPHDIHKINYKGIQIELIKLHSRNLLPKNNLGWLIKYMEFIIKFVYKQFFIKTDVFHAHNLDALLPGYIVSRIKHTRIIYDSHELFTEMAGKNDNVINRIWFKIEKHLLRKVDFVIAANNSRAEIMLNEYGAKELPTVIMNIPDINNTSANLKKNIFQDYLISKNISQKKIVLYQGGIVKHRNISYLVKSVAKWHNDFALVLLGPITELYKNELVDIMTEYSINNRVYFHPPVNSSVLLNFTKLAYIGVVIYNDSTRNNYLCAPNKLFEYTLSGVPIIGCDFPEIERVNSEFGVGELFCPDNIDSISSAINKMLDSKDKYMNKEKISSITKKYNWNDQKKILLKLYEDLKLV